MTRPIILQAEYDRVTAPAWEEYRRVTDAAQAEYDRVVAAAWTEYNRVSAATMASLLTELRRDV